MMDWDGLAGDGNGEFIDPTQTLEDPTTLEQFNSGELGRHNAKGRVDGASDQFNPPASDGAFASYMSGWNDTVTGWREDDN